MQRYKPSNTSVPTPQLSKMTLASHLNSTFVVVVYGLASGGEVGQYSPAGNTYGRLRAINLVDAKFNLDGAPARNGPNFSNALKLLDQFFKFKPGPRRGLLRPDPVFIIGMHRSGTSALGGVLEPLGLTVGKSIMPPDPEGRNPKGFYENLALMGFHDRFLSSIDSVWHHPEPLGEERFQGSEACRFQNQLLRLLINEFGRHRPLIKDPRMCRLMPLWLPLIKEHFPLARFILPIRHPVEVAYSLRQRDHLTLNQGLKLWVSHVLEGERTTREFPRLFTSYDELMQSPVETVLDLAKSLGLSEDGVAAAVSRQIDSTLRHHTDLSWPVGEPHEELTLSIHQTLMSGEAAREKKLDQLRHEYYRLMGWPCTTKPFITPDSAQATRP